MEKLPSREKIIKGLLKLLEKYELSEISIKQIVVASQVGRASFYRHFDSKKAVLRAYIDELFADWTGQYWDLGHKDDDAMLKIMFDHFRKNKDFYQLLYCRGLFSLIYRPIQNTLSYNPTGSNVEAYLSAFFSSGIYGWLEEWTSRGMQEDAEEMMWLLKSRQK